MDGNKMDTKTIDQNEYHAALVIFPTLPPTFPVLELVENGNTTHRKLSVSKEFWGAFSIVNTEIFSGENSYSHQKGSSKSPVFLLVNPENSF